MFWDGLIRVLTIIVTNIVEYELKEKNHEGELRGRYVQYFETLQSQVKDILLLDIKTILDMHFEIFEENNATKRVMHFLEGVSQQNPYFSYLIKKVKTDSDTFYDDVSKILDNTFYCKDYNNMGEYSILYTW